MSALGLASVAAAISVSGAEPGAPNGSHGVSLVSLPRSELLARDENPTDFGWIEKWAAIGDSFTAGKYPWIYAL